jgi:nitrile hydratase beta subunit
MNGVHDLGGMHGFGPVHKEDQASFHAPWEMRVYAMMGVMRRRGVFNVDEMRRAIESLPPAEYLSSGYFERWLAALRMLLIEKGIFTGAEMDAVSERIAQPPAPAPSAGRPNDPALTEAIVESFKQRAPGFTGGAAATPRFRAGDRVIARNAHVKNHTRLPRYARGKRGTIHKVHGVATFPDSNAHGVGKNPQPVYSVRFAAQELWGENASPEHVVYIDLWESYLNPA